MVYYGQISWSWITIMTLSGRALFWLLSCASFLPGKAVDPSYIRGVPGRDYPNYSSIPQTSFRCSEQLHIPGLYADPETRCQVFHHCYEHRQESFLCPLGTVFNQAILACDYWYSANCSAAQMYYDTNSPHNAIIYDTEPGYVPMKNSPDNLFDKIASLYKVNDGFTTPNDSENEAYSLEDNHSFIDRELRVQSKPVIKNINVMETLDHYDRRNIVLDEPPEGYEYIHNNEDLDDNIQNFEDSFEGSGETEEFEGDILSHGSYLWPSNEKGNFDNRQFAIMQEEHVEDKTKSPDHSDYKDKLTGHLTDSSHVHHSYSKGSSLSGVKLDRRHSENNDIYYNRKSLRRKPLFTMNEYQAETTEHTNNQVSTSSIEPVDQGIIPASAESMSTSIFPDSSVTSYKAKRRRKPIVIDLEDSLQYNIDSVRNPDGSAGVTYNVNPHSEMSGISIATEEISVKLIPSEAKRKPEEYLFNLNDIESEEKIESSSTTSYVKSPASNLHYEANTYPNIKEFEISNDDFAENFNRVKPIRKKNKIRIIDSDEKYVDIDDGKQEVTSLPTFQFEAETHPPIDLEFQDFKDYLSDTFEETKQVRGKEFIPKITLNQYEVETDPSDLNTDHDTEKLNNNVLDTHYNLVETHNDGQSTPFHKSDELDQTYIYYTNLDGSLEMQQIVGDGDLDDKIDSITLQSFVGFDLTTHDEIKGETYFTTEPISEISTSMPLEIQNVEDSETKFYLIPHSNFESESDHSGIFKNTWRPVPVTLERNHVEGSFDLHPSYHVHLEDLIGDEITQAPHSEDVEFQTIIADSYKIDTEIKHFPNTELTANILYHINSTSVSSTSQDIANISYTHSGETSTNTSDLLLDAELKNYLSHPNENLDSTTKLDVILAESKQTEDPVTATQSSEIQRHLLDETVDFDTMKEEVVGVGDKTVLELNTNSHQPPKMANTDKLDKLQLKNNEQKGKAEFEDIQSVIDLREDVSETSNQFVSVPPVTTSSILETSENSQFWNNINTLQNSNFNSNKKLSENVGMKADPSHINDGNQLKFTEKPIMKKAHLLPTNQGGQTRPLRSGRTLTSPYQMGFNMEVFGSQYLDGLPSSVLKLKQSNIPNFLSYPGPGFEDGAFYARTGSLLESPKISKLISIGKNLLRSKKAKYRILSRYVNSFISKQ